MAFVNQRVPVLIIDRSHRYWIITVSILFVVSTVLYVAYARTTPGGPTGGSWQGLGSKA